MLRRVRGMRRRSSAGMVAFALCLFAGSPAVLAQGTCVGDCDGSGGVGVNELVMMVNIALQSSDMSECAAADANEDGRVSVNELVAAVNAALAGCPPDSECADAQPFNSTFEAIQQVIFERYGCTQAVCHGSLAKQGGLELTPDVAYQNIIEKRSSSTSLNYIEPGDKDRSYLWLKLAAKTNPDLMPQGFQIVGSPMPNLPGALTENELEALRLWISSGAPETGTVAGTETLLDACLPPPEPITIKPLDPPAAGEGIQFVMPPWPLAAKSEHEICFATYYDITDQVPPQFKDPSGNLFRFSESELRQDPQSHHLILNRYSGSTDDIHDPAFGAWTCIGGARAGETCEPTDLSSCGEGTCRSEIKESFACIGFGPATGGAGRYPIGGAQAAQSHDDYIDGVFAQFPMKGILLWNSHAFNLTDTDTELNARLNYYFAPDQRFPVRGIFDASHIFSANAAPFTTQTICNDHVLPQGARLFALSSHTHKHGKHFTVALPSSELIYESFIYNDPVDLTFDPPMAFDSPNRAERTLRYCSLYNNGVAADGSPDPDTVTRRSRVPSSAAQTIGLCNPLACAEGNVGAPCNGVGDDRACDSSPGANDGFCDACNITGGESTENEMFILIGSYYIGNPASEAESSAATPALRFELRSDSTEVALPASMGCGSSAGAHAEHAQHQ
jgi:hypothetical protein